MSNSSSTRWTWRFCVAARSQGGSHHSDRGSHYTSRAYQQRLEQAQMMVSMSRKGNCWDNAAMESFFGSRHARNVWAPPSIHLMNKLAERFLSIWKFTITEDDGIRRWDM